MMMQTIDRRLTEKLKTYLSIFPAVAILGPRQCGKSTLVKNFTKKKENTLFVDLQNEADLAKLENPLLFFDANTTKLICLDEIQLTPNLFNTLRSVIDLDRRNGRFILLGSASKELLQKTSETLAGRIGLLYLTPFTVEELYTTTNYKQIIYWMRGGFPDSYLALSDENSSIWRDNYIKTYIERDIPQLGFNIPSLQLKRFLMMCAHNQGQLINYSKLGESLNVTHPTIKRYIDLLEQTFIVRTLQPFELNIKKRLVKAPKVYIRDSGILHQLLSITSYNNLMGHPVFGSSWEGLVIENCITAYPDWQYYFYRSAIGEEIDLILEKGTVRIAIECKAAAAPKLSKGFWKAIETIKPTKTFVIIPTSENYSITYDVTICGLEEFLQMKIIE